MGKQLTAKEFILALGEPYFHEIRKPVTGISWSDFSDSKEVTKELGLIIGMESQKYALALKTLAVGYMPDQKAEFLLYQLITRMEGAHAIREIGGKQICKAVDRIYETYSQLKKHLTE